MQAPQCLIEECPNPPGAHGLCSDHSRISFVHHHPMTGRRNGADVMMAGQFFDSLSTEQPPGVEKLVKVRPVVRVPFIPDESTFRYHNYRGPKDAESFSYKPKPRLTLREELVEGIREANVLDRPIVFLVATNIPHTGIYILYGGQFYSVAYGYDRSRTPVVGSLYSIDIPLIQSSEARIVWVGILTDAIMMRLQKEFDEVTDVVANFEDADVAGKPLIVDRLMFFHIPKVYGGLGADSNPAEWNCTKWAMHVLFGGMPKNFRELVSRTNPGLTREDLTRWLTAYERNDQAEFIRVLNDINHASFPKFSRGSRVSKGSAGGSRTTKRKTIKMRKTRKMH